MAAEMAGLNFWESLVYVSSNPIQLSRRKPNCQGSNEGRNRNEEIMMPFKKHNSSLVSVFHSKQNIRAVTCLLLGTVTCLL